MKLNGWKKLGNNVYEWEDGRRLHLFGTCMMTDKRFLSASNDKTVWDWIRRNGGNRKRGLMAWAQSLR